MGREIRNVPPHWKHPESEDEYRRMRLQPMHDRTFAEAARQWKEEFAAWERGERPDYASEASKALEFWEYHGGPPTDRAYYRTYDMADATWVQLWETVSEGTPVSPPFATVDELIAHLAEHGDEWDGKRGHGAWGMERAKAFCADGWAPSFVMIDGKLLEGTELALHAKATGATP